MTDKEILDKYKEMEEYFGTLVNFEHYPRQFAYQVKLFNYYKERQNESSSSERPAP